MNSSSYEFTILSVLMTGNQFFIGLPDHTKAVVQGAAGYYAGDSVPQSDLFAGHNLLGVHRLLLSPYDFGKMLMPPDEHAVRIVLKKKGLFFGAEDTDHAGETFFAHKGEGVRNDGFLIP